MSTTTVDLGEAVYQRLIRLAAEQGQAPEVILDQALAVAALYLKEGQLIASVRTRQGAPQQFTARGEEHLTAVPLIALVDGYSASAS